MSANPDGVTRGLSLRCSAPAEAALAQRQRDAEQAVVRHGVLHAAAAYLPKPLVPSVLARRVREVRDGAALPAH
jgi:hypothetical protein